MTSRFFPGLFLLLCLPWPAAAETFTPESAAALAVRRNPGLIAARFSVEEAHGRALQTGRLPAPELETEFAPNLRGREGSFGIGFTQKFPLTNRLRLERAVSEALIAAAEAEVEAAEQKLAAEVKTAAVRWMALRDSQALKQKQIANGAALTAEMNRLVERGEGSPVEAAQLELESQQLSLEVLRLESERAALLGGIRPMLGIFVEENVTFTGSLEITPPVSPASSQGMRADQRAARAKMDVARRNAELAKAGKWEDMTVGLGYEREHVDDAGSGLEKENSIRLKFSFPLPLSRNNHGKLIEAQAAFTRAEAESAALDALIASEKIAARAEMDAARRMVSETADKLLPKAKELEEKITAFLRQGQPGAAPSDVLRARERRLALEQARLDALLTFHLARIRFQAASGH